MNHKNGKIINEQTNYFIKINDIMRQELRCILYTAACNRKMDEYFKEHLWYLDLNDDF